MAHWKLGEAQVEALIGSGELQKLTGDAANGERLLAQLGLVCPIRNYPDPGLMVRSATSSRSFGRWSSVHSR